MSEQVDRRYQIIAAEGVSHLLQALAHQGYRLIGPTIREGVIVYQEIQGSQDLPRGWRDVQEAGRYRLERRKDSAYFGFVVGPHSWKQFLFVPRLPLFEVRRQKGKLVFVQPEPEPEKLAFIGVRACELAAIAIQDRVFLQGQWQDPDYARRRENLFLLAVNCVEPAATCFCVSMHTGPRAREGFDLALTEILDGDRHEFLVETGSARGEAVLREVASRPAREADLKHVEALMTRAAQSMTRELDAEKARHLLPERLEHPHWQQVAQRCLSCANCTLVCPTCFCHTVEEETDLSGQWARRQRKWDSCFTAEHSYLHGGSIRASVSARYRQWLTHKLSTWYDQFGTTGCVGCGRCITWCPVGIDITREAAQILDSPPAEKT